MYSIQPNNIKTIAMVRLSAIGDVTMVAGIVPCLRQHFPLARIVWVTTAQTHALLKGLPGVEFIVIKKPKSLKSWWRARQALRGLRADVLLAMQASLSANMIYPLIKAQIKIGFDKARARDGHGLTVNRTIPAAQEHLVDGFLAFVKALGVPDPKPRWHFPVQGDDQQWVDNTLVKPGSWLAIHPVSSRLERTWRENNYAELIAQTVNRLGVNVILTGGVSEFEQNFIARVIAQSGVQCVNAAGLSLKRMMALLGSVDAIVAPDTVAVHMGVAMNTPVVGLYAVSNPLLTGPYACNEYVVNAHSQALKQLKRKDPDRASIHDRVHDRRAMDLIGIEQVMMQLHKIFRSDVCV